jgi:hypothetical protein
MCLSAVLNVPEKEQVAGNTCSGKKAVKHAQ